MNIYISLAILCGGILIGFLLRCIMIMEYNDGVNAGYKRCQSDREQFESGWRACEASRFTSRIPEPSDLPPVSESASIDPEDWEDAIE